MSRAPVMAVMAAWVLLGAGLGPVAGLQDGSVARASSSAVSLASAAADSQARQELEQVMQDARFSRWKIRQQRMDHLRIRSMTMDEKLQSHLDAIGQSIERFLDWLFRRRTSTPVSAGASRIGAFDVAGMLKIFGWVLVGATLLLLAWFLFSRWRQRGAAGAAPPVSRQTLAAAMATGHALAGSSDDWAAHALALAQEKDMRLAFRAMYLALLSGLHSAGRIRYRPQQTNWVYVMGFKGETLQRESFADLTRQFDDIWYGQREPDRALFDSIHGRIEQLLRKGAP